MGRTIMVPGYGVRIEHASNDEVHGIAKAIASDIRSNMRMAGFHTMASSVRVRRRVRGSLIRIGGRRAPYWAIFEYGAPPHIIRAKLGKVLRFIKDNGEVVFAKWARHPGTRAYAFVRRAVYKRRTL
jgi:hypothetical protein